MNPVALFANATVDLWVKAESIEGSGRVNTPTYSRSKRGVSADLQPVSQQSRMMGGLDPSTNYRKLFLPATVTALPAGTIVVDTRRGEYWRLDENTRPDFWPAVGPVAGHWEAYVTEIIGVPEEVSEAY